MKESSIEERILKLLDIFRDSIEYKEEKNRLTYPNTLKKSLIICGDQLNGIY